MFLTKILQTRSDEHPLERGEEGRLSRQRSAKERDVRRRVVGLLLTRLWRKTRPASSREDRGHDVDGCRDLKPPVDPLEHAGVFFPLSDARCHDVPVEFRWLPASIPVVDGPRADHQQPREIFNAKAKRETNLLREDVFNHGKR